MEFRMNGKDDHDQTWVRIRHGKPTSHWKIQVESQRREVNIPHADRRGELSANPCAQDTHEVEFDLQTR